MGSVVLGEKTDIQVPPDDGSITQALTELDAKVAAWAAIMRAAKEGLAKVSAGNRRRAKTVDRSENDWSAPGDADSEPCVDTTALTLTVDSGSVDAEPTSSGNDQMLTLAQDEAETAEDIEVQAEADAADEIKPAQEPMEAALADPFVEKEIEASEATCESSRDVIEDEDATLLATLDPEIAKAIRVMRRLAPVKKSVRELLSEYEANNTQEQIEQPQKKSWFHRRR